MPPIETGPTRSIGRVEPLALNPRAARTAAGLTERQPAAERAPAIQVETEALDPGEAPVDMERVAQIRKAIEAGDYPVIPTTVADAIIAAGFLLRAPK